ncbi:MAG: 16S rRNA (guanine(966)-N(2))-methyltransferase RsmD [Clostridia bacterium]|nr:16S rRNA (guanine(966)-N(2))-methyltransferase RsmD [Clostridia bacterium]
MRVIAGSAKGREILAPKGLNTRPTLAKVKEAMFGMLQFDLEGANVLDLFAGSGGLGIEAISRGAAHVTFCDADRHAVSVVKANLKKLAFEDRASVVMGDAISLLGALAERGERFDIVLLDPPYETDLQRRAISILAEKGLLNDGAILVCEHSNSNPPVFPAGFDARKAKKYGDSYLTYATYEGADE